MHEARFFVDELRRRRLDRGAVVLNRTLPASMRDRAAAKSAAALAAAVEDRAWARKVARAATADIASTVDVLTTAAAGFQDIAVVAKREAERRAELAQLASVVVSAPALESDVHDLAGLFTLGAHLWR